MKGVQKQSEDSGQAYFKNVWEEAREKNKPLAYRRGGGSCWGIRGDEPESAASRWVAFGVPEERGPQTFATFIANQGWAKIEGVSAPRHPRQGWLFAGLPSEKAEKFAYNEGEAIAIRRWVRKASNWKENDAGRAKWFKEPEEKPTTDTEKMDTDQTADNGGRSAPGKSDKPPEGQGGNEKEESPDGHRPAEGMPPKKHPRTTPEQKEGIPQGRLPHSLVELDFGSNGGDCGYRHIACVHAIAMGGTSEFLKEKAELLAEPRRIRTHAPLRDHNEWRHRWAVGDAATEQTEGGTIPKNQDKWLESVLRPKRWACEETAGAAARVLALDLLVWSYDEKSAKYKFVTRVQATRGKNAEEVIPLFVRDQDYTTAMMPSGKAWPKEWRKLKPGSSAEGPCA